MQDNDPATKEPEGTVQNSKKGTTRGQTQSTVPLRKQQRLSKTHADYWFKRLRKRSYADRNGKLAVIADWQMRLKSNGRDSWFNTDTANRGVAAVKAQEIYVFFKANGWDATLAKYKPKAEERTEVTVGGFLAQVKAVGGLKPGTFEIYARKFRSLVADVCKIDSGNAKHDYVNGGYQAWLEKVHAIRLEKLTPEKVNAWKVNYLKAASANPLKLKRASVTARSVLLSSKSLFGGKVRRHLTLRLPSPLPFEGVVLPKVRRSRYKSEVGAQTLLVAAKRELSDAPDTPAPAEPKKRGGQKYRLDRATRLEMFKIILLALGAGLRRDEIDTLTWKQLDFSRNVIGIETNIYTAAKSEESENEVDVDPGLMAVFKGYMAGSQGAFVIQSPVAPRPAAVSYHHYRCQRLFKLVIDWLRSKGVSSRNALHTLRKEFGSQICAQAGIFAASLALRHSNISLTRDYYLEKKKPAFLAVTELMEGQAAIEAVGKVA